MQQRDKVQQTLISWAIGALRRWAEVAADEWPAQASPQADAWLANYGRLLSGAWQPDGKGDRLLSIFSLIRPNEGKAVQPVFVPARPLSLETILPDEQSKTIAPKELWGEFVSEFERLPTGDGRFETFFYLFQKYAWTVPCSYGKEGVSLYEEFKALAALVHASDGAERPAEQFLLVGGDVPGIQSFIYTITSKGAAKGLRGRSFFLQLLGDAVVRRLVVDLDLCSGNAVYAAGGNFVLLAPVSSKAVLQEWSVAFNRALLDEFESDLYLALAWENLPQTAVGTSEFAKVRERLGAKVAIAKGRRFAEIVAGGDWASLFQPQGRGGSTYCQVCQREPRPGEELASETTETGEVVVKCHQCRSFEALARDIAHDRLWMIVAETSQAEQMEEGWQRTLARLTGLIYRFEHDLSRVSRPEMMYTYALNDTAQESTGIDGFRFIANVTPRIEKVDREWASKHHPELEVPQGEPIKDFALMAVQSQGIDRVGVLRMDVDNLGAIFSQHLQGSMVQVSTLSAALDIFFAGHLNRIFRDVAAQGEHDNTIYAIYAGGDDLFVVGAWDRMPLLAERIQADFSIHTGHNPYLTLSGGVTMEGRKFPLYRAAERAGEAEGKAKGYRRPNGHDKDAFCFLGQPVGWEEWPLVRETEHMFSHLITAGMPRTLIQIVRIVHALYRAACRRTVYRGEENTRKVCYGRWMWTQAYALARLADRAAQHNKPSDARERVRALQKGILTPETVHLSGLAARWAEYLMR